MYTVRGKNPPAKGKPPVVIHGRLLHIQIPSIAIPDGIQLKNGLNLQKKKRRIAPTLTMRLLFGVLGGVDEEPVDFPRLIPVVVVIAEANGDFVPVKEVSDDTSYIKKKICDLLDEAKKKALEDNMTAFYSALEVLGNDEEYDLFFEVDENGDAVAHDHIFPFLLCKYAVGKTFCLLCVKERMT